MWATQAESPFQAKIEHHRGERPVRRGYRNVIIVSVALALLGLALSPLLLERLERAMISTGPNGPETSSYRGARL